MTQAMTSTTAVRMVVPRLLATPWIPILPRMAVSAANRAEPKASRSQEPFSSLGPSVSFFWIISQVPTPIRTTQSAFSGVTCSCRNRKASMMVRMVLDLSIGTTLLILPICRARK